MSHYDGISHNLKPASHDDTVLAAAGSTVSGWDTVRRGVVRITTVDRIFLVVDGGGVVMRLVV